MKNLIILLLAGLLLTSCGDPITKNGKTYECYGFFDKDEIKSQDVKYSFVGMNLFPMVIFSKTIIVPVLLLGFQTHCPIQEK